MEKVKVNQDVCIGCGACVALAEEVFNFNDEGFAEAKPNNNILDKMDEEVKENVIDAIEGCPTSAIEKYNDEEENN